jgi:hypothetical protein
MSLTMLEGYVTRQHYKCVTTLRHKKSSFKIFHLQFCMCWVFNSKVIYWHCNYLTISNDTTHFPSVYTEHFGSMFVTKRYQVTISTGITYPDLRCNWCLLTEQSVNAGRVHTGVWLFPSHLSEISIQPYIKYHISSKCVLKIHVFVSNTSMS